MKVELIKEEKPKMFEPFSVKVTLENRNDAEVLIKDLWNLSDERMSMLTKQVLLEVRAAIMEGSKQ